MSTKYFTISLKCGNDVVGSIMAVPEDKLNMVDIDWAVSECHKCTNEVVGNHSTEAKEEES